MKVEQLPHEVDESCLRSIFEPYGTVTSLKLNRTSDAFNFAYVNYANEEDAIDAVDECNNRIMLGTRINVKLKNPVGLRVNVPHRRHQILPLVSTTIQYTVKVEHLPSCVTESNLVDVFKSCGTVISAKVNPTKTFSKYAYVNYANQEDAQRAVKKFNESNVFPGSRIRVKLHQSNNHKADNEIDATISSHYKAVHQTISASAPTGSNVSNPKQSTCVTIKVSIQTNGELNITPEDLSDIFGHYGTITHVPVIKPGIPPYTYINFSTPDEAKAACELDQKIVKTHFIKVKVVDKQVANLDITRIQCSSLVGKILFGVYRSELLNASDEVTVKPNKMHTVVKISGKANKLGDAEKKVRALLARIENEVTKETRSLQHFHLPSFGNHQVVDMVRKIEDEHFVAVQVVNCNGYPSNVEDLVKYISVLQPYPGKEAIEVSQLLAYLHVIPSISLSVPQQSLLKSQSQTIQKYAWFWKSDDGDYCSYSDSLSERLTKQYKTSPQHPFKLNILQNDYLIDFDEMTQTNMGTNYKRKIKLEVQQVSTQIIPTQYQHAMTLLSSPSPTALTIESIPCVSSTGKPTRHIRIEIQGIKSHINASFDDLSSALDKLVMESKCNLDKADLIADDLLNITDHYCVEARVDSTEGLLIKGDKEYVDKVTLVVQRECIKFLKEKVIARPEYWAPQSEKVVLISISQSSPEWKKVIPLMHQTLPKARVMMLQRIQNVWLWDRYAFAKKRMSEKNGESFVNEKYLFHGTASTSPEKIYRSEKGFDFRFSSGDNLWGAGTYFAVNASYSDRYVYRSGQQQVMIVATVLTGEACTFNKPDRTLKKPPLKQQDRKFEGDLYDSIKGHSNGSDIFVIYDHEKAYPAYLITYC